MSADFWAGYISGAAGIIIGNPLDLIKTRLQAGPSVQNVETTSSATTGGVVAPRGFKGQFENAGTLVRGESLPYTSLHSRQDQPHNQDQWTDLTPPVQAPQHPS
jgi:solute carrier family 25 carnitine/acylcarnitine transporter 20/29